jgi:hypothetical protein
MTMPSFAPRRRFLPQGYGQQTGHDIQVADLDGSRCFLSESGFFHSGGV